MSIKKLKDLIHGDFHIIDSHCHLQYIDPSFLDETLMEARNNNVQTIINVAVKKTDSKDYCINNYNLMKDTNVFFTVGNHPSEKEIYHYNNIIEDSDNIIAVGETGMDFYHKSNPNYETQRDNFVNQIMAAKHLGLSVIVHSRNAEMETYQILDEYKPRFILHCFTGSLDFATKLLDLGGYISISGIVSYPNADSLREVVKFIPASRLLVETDVPFLTPASYRPKSNRPGFIVETFRKIAELKGLCHEDLLKVSFENTINAFAWK